jgi:hypothetical protein
MACCSPELGERNLGVYVHTDRFVVLTRGLTLYSDEADPCLRPMLSPTTHIPQLVVALER